MTYWLFNDGSLIMVYETIHTELGSISSPTNHLNNRGPYFSLLGLGIGMVDVRRGMGHLSVV